MAKPHSTLHFHSVQSRIKNVGRPKRSRFTEMQLRHAVVADARAHVGRVVIHLDVDTIQQSIPHQVEAIANRELFCRISRVLWLRKTDQIHHESTVTLCSQTLRVNMLNPSLR